MALSDYDQAKIREYLLGRLSDEEQERIEERLMTEDDLFEELEISKGELIEEYSSGALPQNEHQWFERHYLATPEGRQRQTFTMALNCLERPAPVLQSLTFFERLRSFFEKGRLRIITAGAAALPLVIALAFLIPRTTPQTSLAVTLTNTVNQRSLTASVYHKVSLTPDVGELKISLKLPEPGSSASNYRAELDDRLQVNTLNPTAHDASSVLVTIPAAQLKPGYYALRLYALQADGTKQPIAGEYLFEITN